MVAELKREGLGSIVHHPVTAETDRTKLYTSVYLNPATPSGLFNKVHFDIRLYFFRRGCENISNRTKHTFVIKKNVKTGLRFVTKGLDELTKNPRESDKENISPIMPETPGSPYCPVRSFEKYISKLNPELDRLWQRSLSSFTDDDDVWYAKVPVGAKTIATFMSDLIKKCDLSKNYTNHSFRATGATMLSKGMYSPSQIMAVTGHKSVHCLIPCIRGLTRMKR
ncbi:uncharacterized protein LOC134253355 [Saccostrea cucullata]|uniref:uncharacterized protein LOC134253355 n=1 Tax=Saccostrea cuccullata TaxID=36930 RepID=UPI002ED1CC88